MHSFGSSDGAFGSGSDMKRQDWWTAAIWVWLMIIVVSLVVINIAC